MDLRLTCFEVYFKTKIMKKSIFFILFHLMLSNYLFAQQRETIVVLNIDVKRLSITPSELGQLTRYELDKLDTFNVVDKYELIQLVSHQKINLDECFSKSCMLEVAKAAGAKYAVSGSAERLQDKIFFNLRLIQVDNPSKVKSTTIEFLPYTNQIQLMTHIALLNLLDLETPTDIVEQLTESGAINSGLNNPYYHNLNLSGPRMGVTYISPKLANHIHLDGLNDGQKTSPFFTQFGYQFETQYLSENNFQALFEFIPMISGLDQGLVLPSVTVLNGFRNSATGMEIAFGPGLSLSSTSTGYYSDGQWIKVNEDNPAPPGAEVITRTDRNGEVDIQSYVVIAAGKTFTQGRLNIPINMYAVPSIHGWRYGLSVGFNAKN